MLRRLLGMSAVALTAGPLHAQGWIEIERPPNRLAPAVSITRISSRVSVTVDGRVAKVEVEERFRNDGGGLAEGNYLYPLPAGAVFQNFSLWMGEQEIKGEVMNADQARGIYEEIVRRQRDPALLTLAGHGLVRAQVFPIPPGQTRKVALRYTCLLERSGDAVRLRFTAGDRGPTEQPLGFHVSVIDAANYGSPYSPTHQLTTQRNGDRLDISVDVSTGGDIELFLPLHQGLVSTSVVTHAAAGEDGFFMLLLSPPPVPETTVVPRDLTLVVDVSGSMSGGKLDQAKAGLLQALGTMTPRDRFRLIAFSSAVRRFRDEPVAASSVNVAAARAFVQALEADGGTNIEGALDAALEAPSAEGRLGIVVFMTDGLPSVGEQAPDRLADRAGRRIGGNRIFTVGVGHDVNTYLLDRLASEGRGSAEYVVPDASVETAMGVLLGKLRFPALVNLRIVNAPVRLLGQSPATLPDLFYGQELVVLGRYHGAGEGDVVIEGERNGRRERFTSVASFAADEPRNEFVPRLWASRRIGDLTRQIRLEGASESLIGQVRDLGLRYGILTDYTSYLVQEPTMVTAAGPALIRRQMPVVAPAPAAQSGQVAFEAASRSAKMSSASNLAAADMAAAVGSSDARERSDERRAGGRVFRLRNGIWTDVAHVDSLHVRTVAPFSTAYFALVRALPELGRCLAVGDRVLVAGRRVSVRIAPAGVTEWRAGELDALVSSFRGT